MIRLATPADAAAMLEIYTPFILTSGITQETELPSTSRFGERIKAGLENYPWLVFTDSTGILGYAYASRHRERAGYQWCVETSVYLSGNAYGRGVGQALYTALFRILKWQGFVNAYAVITLPNEKSIRFHEKFGYEYFTTFKKVGYKLGQWHDVGWMICTINDYPDRPAAPVSFSALDPLTVQSLLKEVNDARKPY